MRTERLEMFGHLISQFERDTVQTRGINSFCATQRAAREKETRRIDAENAKLLATEEAKLHQNKEKLAKMAQANADMDAKYGQQCKQGVEDAAKLAKYKAYLAIEHDEVPDLKQ